MRLGHINPNRIQRLIKDGLLEPLDFDEFLVCESCLEGKMTKRPFNAKVIRAQDLLELVHSNVCDPIQLKQEVAMDLSLLSLMIMIGHKLNNPMW